MTNQFPPVQLVPISNDIWNGKYRYNNEPTIEDSWQRVAFALAAAEDKKHRAEWMDHFYCALHNFKFIPAGRILAGAGTGRSVTLFNCLHGSERLYTMEHGLIELEKVVGQDVTVLTKSGWTPAQIKSFGVQKTNIITFVSAYNHPKNGWLRSGKTNFYRQVIATPDHGWILDGGERTTNLKVGDTVEACAYKVDTATTDYVRGFCHGVIFSDGSFVSKHRIGGTENEFHCLHQIRLCGEKRKLFKYFEQSDRDFSYSYPPSSKGDPHISFYAPNNCKELPGADYTPDYYAGFIAGLIATDGCEERTTTIVSTQNVETVEWLRQNAPLGGYIYVGKSRFNTVGYGNRKSPCVNVRLRPASDVKWKVVSIKPHGAEDVYCAVVPGLHAFTLEGGLYTSNCFVSDTIPDSMDGIFRKLREAALTMQQGGGIGYDFSTLRPKGALVRGVGADASGPISFMDVFDSMCKTIMSAGYRRGAMMGVMRCDHPDIEAFLEVKRDKTRLRNFNISVLITNAFMEAVINDQDWNLVFEGKVYKTIKARPLFDRITQGAYDCAEPGVIFIDRVNEENNLKYCEVISASNPCSEQMLPPYGACLLGSINLAAFIVNPFQESAHLSIDEVYGTVQTAVRMLDNVVDVSQFPLKEQAEEGKAKRRIGLGITGLGDALAMMKIHYGSREALIWAGQTMQNITEEAYATSINLAKEKGAFPAFNAKYFDSPFVQRLSGFLNDHGSTLKTFREHGIRNSHLTSIQPTGTISLLAGNVSGGIEPMFDYEYTRRILNPDGTHREETVTDFAVAKYREMFGADATLPDYFTTAQKLTPGQHIAMQAALQPFVDSAISKTVNCPKDMPFEEFQNVYIDSHRLGLKCCACFRPNDITGSILVSKEDKKEKEDNKADGEQEKPNISEKEIADIASVISGLPATIDKQPLHWVDPAQITPRDECLHGATYKLKWPLSDHAFYVTINDVIENGVARPYEIFINSKNMEAYPWILGLTRMISGIFRRGGDVAFVADELKAVFDPRGGAWMEGRYIPSLLAAIGDVVHRHIDPFMKIEPMSDEALARISNVEKIAVEAGQGPLVPRKLCPKCFSANLAKKPGCVECLDCNYSSCS